MLAVVSRTTTALSTVALLFSITSTASAQFYGAYNPYAPVAIGPPVVAANPCPCLQPVTETVYNEVPVTKYRTVQQTVQKPVVRTEYEERKVTAFRQVWDSRVAQVPTMTYQNVTETRQVTQNRSYWQTAWQPIPKVTPLQYDPTPTLAGAINRLGYSLRMTVTPNYIPQRQFVPNVVVHNVPVTRTVAVPGTREVTYNVARMEPYTTTQRIAVQKVDMVDEVVTRLEAYTDVQRVAVGTTTRYTYVDPTGGRTALNPTPDSGDDRAAESNDGPFNTLSYPQPRPEPTPHPSYRATRVDSNDADSGVANVTRSPAPTVVRAAGWRPSRDAVAAPRLSIAAN